MFAEGEEGGVRGRVLAWHEEFGAFTHANSFSLAENYVSVEAVFDVKVAAAEAKAGLDEEAGLLGGYCEAVEAEGVEKGSESCHVGRGWLWLVWLE